MWPARTCANLISRTILQCETDLEMINTYWLVEEINNVDHWTSCYYHNMSWGLWPPNHSADFSLKCMRKSDVGIQLKWCCVWQDIVITLWVVSNLHIWPTVNLNCKCSKFKGCQSSVIWQPTYFYSTRFSFPGFTIHLLLHSIWGGHYRGARKGFHWIYNNRATELETCVKSIKCDLLLSSSQHPCLQHAVTVTALSQLPHTNCYNNIVLMQ